MASVHDENMLLSMLFDLFSKNMTFSDEEKRAIMEIVSFRVEKKGTILLKEGQITNKMYIVLKGCIRIFYVINGEEKTTSFYTEAEGVSPYCDPSKQPSEYLISCVEDTIIAETSIEAETTLFEKFPRLETFCRKISEQLLTKEKMSFDEFKTSSPEQRYLNLLKTRPALVQRVPQYQLASFLGITPQSLSRLRARVVQKK
jgi:CRP-like cAMP-binding protein